MMLSCAICNGTLTPINKAIVECPSCGALYDETNVTIPLKSDFKDSKEFKEMDKVLQGKSDSVKTLMQAQLVLHGRQMWVEGFKEGLLLAMKRSQNG